MSLSRFRQKSKADLFVRTNSIKEGDLPATAKILISGLSDLSKQLGLQSVKFEVDKSPMSVNKQYKHTRFNTRLKEQVHEFRRFMLFAMGPLRYQWKPKGVTAAVVLLENPIWLTKERKVRQVDADNKIKPIFDAIEQATNVPDELYWEFHVYKIASRRIKTTVHLFDVGDIVDYVC